VGSPPKTLPRAWKTSIHVHILTHLIVSALKALLNGSKTTDGKPALTHKKFPSCFYADGTYDPKNTDAGLFRSQFLLRVRPCSIPVVYH
jgi:hypothetical protein